MHPDLFSQFSLGEPMLASITPKPVTEGRVHWW